MKYEVWVRREEVNKKDLVLVKWSELKAKFYNQREDFDQWRELFPASSYRSWSINRVMMICMSLNKLQNFHRWLVYSSMYMNIEFNNVDNAFLCIFMFVSFLFTKKHVRVMIKYNNLIAYVEFLFIRCIIQCSPQQLVIGSRSSLYQASCCC